MITRPDEYKHQNDNYAIVDNDNVRGGIFDLVTISNANLLTLPLDKRQLRTTITNGSDNKHYVYTGSTLDDTAWGTVGNWTVASGSGYTHPTGFTNQPSVALTSGNVISQITVNSNGHTTGVVSRLLTPSDIGAATTSHIHSNATTSVAGFMSSTDKTKLDGIAAGAESNQNAFSYVTVGATTLSATGETDTLTLSAGTGITLTPDVLTKSVVVSSIGGSSAYGFSTIKVQSLTGETAQSDVVADSVNDTLTIRQGYGISMTTTPASDYITIAANNYSAPNIPDYVVSSGSSAATIQAGIIATLPLDKNLKGAKFKVRFPRGTPSSRNTYTSTIALSGYHNGSIIFMCDDSDTTRSYISTTSNFVSINNGYNLNISFVDLDIELSQDKRLLNTSTYPHGMLQNTNLNVCNCVITPVAGNSLTGIILLDEFIKLVNIVKSSIIYAGSANLAILEYTPNGNDTFSSTTIDLNISSSTCTSTYVTPYIRNSAASQYGTMRDAKIKVCKFESSNFCSDWTDSTNWRIL